MIIYGTRTFKLKKGHTMGKKHCDHCQNDSEWQLCHLWTWFTLFFVPIFPLYRKRVLICPMCEYGIKVNRNNKDQIMSEIEK